MLNATPVMKAAEWCLTQGDSFFAAHGGFHRANNHAFTINFYYGDFMSFKETIIADRVSDYSLYAPTEFFTEAYTTYYEEAGRDKITPAQYGRLIRKREWADWITNNIQNAKLGPSGTGSGGGATGGGGTGKAAGNPGR